MHFLQGTRVGIEASLENDDPRRTQVHDGNGRATGMIDGIRPYQIEATEAVLRDWQEHQAVAVIHATGLGKTFLSCNIIKHVQPKRTLFLAPARELVEQARQQIESRTGIQCDIEMASRRANTTLFGKQRVVIGTVQTQLGNGRKFCPTDFDYLIIDECHLFFGSAKSFKSVIDHYRQNPNLKILAMTATPKRTDEAAMGQLVDHVSHILEIADATKEGWLVPPNQLFVPVGCLDYSHVRTTAGDLNGADLAKVLEEERTLQEMIQPTLELCWSVKQYSLSKLPVEDWQGFLEANGRARKAIIFCTTVVQAERFAEVMNRAVPGSTGFVCGKTPDKERDKTLSDFKTGKLKFLSNVGICVTGFDDPSVEMLVMAHPTKSLLRYTQMIGRALRTLPGTIDGVDSREARLEAIAQSPKNHALMVDFTGVMGRHKLISTVDVLGGKYDEDIVERTRRKLAEKNGGGTNVEEELRKTAEEIAKEKEERRLRESARRTRLVARTTYRVNSINPFDALDIIPQRARGWDKGKQLSEKQAALLRKQGVDPDTMPYHEAKQVLNELFRRWDKNLASIKQMATIKKHGMAVDGQDLSRSEASALLDMLAYQKGWTKR